MFSMCSDENSSAFAADEMRYPLYSSASNPQRNPESATLGSPFGPTDDEQQYTLLIINDAADQLDLLHTLLSHSGYVVLTASDGSEGFEMASAHRPDLIISDVCMPQVDGISLCRKIREQSAMRFSGS